MAQREYFKSETYGAQRVSLKFFFLTNNGANVVLNSTNLVGVGTDVVSAITAGVAGKYTVVLKDTMPKILDVRVELDDTADDGAYATCGNIVNEGSSSVGPSFDVNTRAGATTTKTNYAGRKVYVNLTFRNSKFQG